MNSKASMAQQLERHRLFRQDSLGSLWIHDDVVSNVAGIRRSCQKRWSRTDTDKEAFACECDIYVWANSVLSRYEHRICKGIRVFYQDQDLRDYRNNLLSSYARFGHVAYRKLKEAASPGNLDIENLYLRDSSSHVPPNSALCPKNIDTICTNNLFRPTRNKRGDKLLSIKNPNIVVPKIWC